MQAIKFPVPNRSEYIPSPYEPDADGVLDIGYYKGSIIGGRPYVLECWQMDELVVATVFFSDEGLDAYSREDLVLLLELEDIIKFIGGKRLFQCTHTGMMLECLCGLLTLLCRMPRVNMQRFCVLYADIDKSVSGEV